MNILVTGGTGTVGSQVVRELSARGQAVKVLTRDLKKAEALPPGATAVEGNLHDVSSIRRIFSGIDAVFLINTVTPTESAEGLMPLTQMRLDGVKRVVYVSVHHADAAAWLPHFGAKVGIEEAIKRSGIPYTILRPNNFYQNDYYFKDVIVQHGVYPQPIGSAGLSRVDVRDIAEAAAIALTTAAHEGQTYDLVGPEVVTGESTAAAWAAALGRDVVYGGDDLEAWEQVQLQYLPDWLVFDFKEMYRYFQQHGLKASADAIARQTALLGHAPRPFRTFAEETARQWTSTGAGA
ncbi:MAG TPA: NmrA family NAD(P)-binding protein [Vicinamibacterales bacterium]|nr:NmrA family NAD(P)-binding protein [Vicinamibacterales bacterium]